MESKATERVKEHVDEIREAYEQGKRSVRDLTEAAAGTSREALAFTDEWVRSNSWKLLGLTMGIGLVIGLLFARSSGERRPERVPR